MRPIAAASTWIRGSTRVWSRNFESWKDFAAASLVGTLVRRAEGALADEPVAEEAATEIELPARVLADPTATSVVATASTDGSRVTVVAPDRIRLRVWERGVGETLACGTGAAAAAYLAFFEGATGPRVVVELPGGELIVDLDGNQAWIEGPAEIVYEGTVA